MDNEIKLYIPRPQAIKAIKITKDNYEEVLALFDSTNEKNDYGYEVWLKNDEFDEILFEISNSIMPIVEGDYLAKLSDETWMPYYAKPFERLYVELPSNRRKEIEQ